MRNKSQFIILTALFSTLIVLVVFAATTTSKAPTTPGKQQGTQVQEGVQNNVTNPVVPNTVTPPKIVTPKPINPSNLVSQSTIDLCKKISNECKQVKGVKDASTVLLGNTAIIGCNVTSNADINKTKKAIISKVKANNKSIQNCVVSCSSNIYSRVNKISNDILKGKSMDATNKDIKNLMNQLTPMAR